jgi:hypothetical protein
MINDPPEPEDIPTTYWVHYDPSTLEVKGHYNSDVHDDGFVIPTPHREVSTEEYLAAIDIYANHFDNDEDWNLIYSSPVETQEEDLLFLASECDYYIRKTDYYMARFYETGEAVPPTVTSQRLKCFTILGDIGEPDTPRIDSLL